MCQDTLALVVAPICFLLSAAISIFAYILILVREDEEISCLRINIFHLSFISFAAWGIIFRNGCFEGHGPDLTSSTKFFVVVFSLVCMGVAAFSLRNDKDDTDGYVLWPITNGPKQLAFGLAAVAVYVCVFVLVCYFDIRAAVGVLVLYFIIASFANAHSSKLERDDGLRFANKNLEHGAAYIDLEGDVNERGMFQTGGIYIGRFAAGKVLWPMYYNGNQHVVLCAPTRAGKGVGFIIPNLLTYEGSTIVVDPKGQNAAVTARRRREMGQTVHILNPFGLHGLQGSHINPLDVLLDAGANLAADTDLLADALVYSSEGNNALHFDSCARDLLSAIMMHVVTAPQFAGRRTLHTVRQIAASAENDFAALVDDMLKSPYAGGVIANKVSRFQKPTNETASIRSTLINQTRLLDISQITEAMTGTDFSFDDLKKGKTTVYLILPANRLDTCNRWLRMMITLALQSITNVQGKPEKPVLFLLDEMPVLGRFAELERAAGFNAGFGVQLFMVVQNLTQLQQAYGRPGWETFMANAGAKIFMRTADVTTTSYFAQLIGETTVTRTSESTSRSTGSNGQGGASTTTTTGTSTQRSAAPVIRKEVMQSLPKEYAAVVYDGITWSCAPPYYDPRCHCVPRGSFDPDPEQVPVGSRPLPPPIPPNTKPPSDGPSPVSNDGAKHKAPKIAAIVSRIGGEVCVRLDDGRLEVLQNVPPELMDKLVGANLNLIKLAIGNILPLADWIIEK
jgi:type IV secretion system protein VirD4